MNSLKLIVLTAYLLSSSCPSITRQKAVKPLPTQTQSAKTNKPKIISYKNVDYYTKVVQLKEQTLHTYYKDDQGNRIGNFNTLEQKLAAKNQTIEFAMNGGIYNKDFSPTGLYIENHKTVIPVNRKEGKGNFYLAPNGILSINSENKAKITNTKDYKEEEQTKTAIQSGPQLLTKGEIHPKFNATSKNVHYRNGVGLIDSHTIVLAMSSQPVNLHTFASFFKDQFSCNDALYLDGFVSKVYAPTLNLKPEKVNFSVIVATLQND